MGGFFTTLYAADPLVMDYTDGLSLDQVAWGRLSLDQISQQTRIIPAIFSLEVTAPFLDQVQSSNAASHILRDKAGSDPRQSARSFWLTGFQVAPEQYRRRFRSGAAAKAINPKFMQNPATEVPPGILTGVPLH